MGANILCKLCGEEVKVQDRLISVEDVRNYFKHIIHILIFDLFFVADIIGKGPQTFSTVFTRIAGDFGLVAQNPLTENGLLFMILSSSAVPVWDLVKTRIIKLFERKHWLRIYRSVIN